jgi:hypothetical protein
MSFLATKITKNTEPFYSFFVPFVSFVANPDTYQNFHHAFFTGSTPPVSL